MCAGLVETHILLLLVQYENTLISILAESLDSRSVYAMHGTKNKEPRYVRWLDSMVLNGPL